MHLPNPVQLATPGFILLVIAEMIYGRLRKGARYEARDTATSLMMGLGNVVVGTGFAFLLVGLAGAVAPYRLFDPGWSWTAFAVCFVGYDLTFYWSHRAAHRIRWMWANHVSHHSSQHYNLSTALRQPWTGPLTPAILFNVPLLVLGFPGEMVAFVAGLNLIGQFWIHTEAIGRLPAPIEFVFNTPSHHRVHHATNARYLDMNYAGVFIIWDRIFGTFVAEDDADPPRYGIVRNLMTFNPLKVAFHEWIAIANDLAHARSPSHFAGYLLGPPGWSPDGSRETTDAIKARWAKFRAAQSSAQAGTE